MEVTERITILIVDDVKIHRMLLRRIFENMYDVDEAENGEEALKLMREKDYFTIVLDLSMPVMNGFDLLKIMRNEDKLKDIPVVVVTASDDEQSQVEAFDLGALDVIFKPFNTRIVMARVKSVIDNRIASDISHKAELLRLKFEQQQRELEKLRFDSLTGLFKRRYFFSEIRRILVENPNKKYVIWRFDIDRFKVFNDVFGEIEGDKLLAYIGRNLKGVTHDTFITSHIEADHFAALFEKGTMEPEDATKAVQIWFNNYSVVFDFSVKAGYYEIDDLTIDTSVMCDRALLALKSVKGVAGQKTGCYDNSLRQKLFDEQTLLSEINTAFEQEQFHVWFQPQYDYAEGTMIGAEALVRWVHPTRGVLPPIGFIPIMEKNGDITRLDEYVWEHCCRHLRKWLAICRRNNVTPPPLSVNISRADMLRPDLADFIVELTKRYDIPHNYLNLEITESVYMDDTDLLIETVEKLRSHCFLIEMDDFGAGYSSLSILKDVTVDILKLDKSFVSGAQLSARGGSILNSVIRMSRMLNLSVIAEGVETKVQADFLKSIGCVNMQGFLFAKAMPADKFEPLYIGASLGCKLEPVESNNNEYIELLLNPANQTSVLFDCFLGGTAVLEYYDGNVELLRANDKYFQMLNTTRAEYAPWITHIQDTLDNGYRQLFLNKLELAIKTKDEVHFESDIKPFGKDVSLICLSVRIRMLSKTANSSMFYLVIDNITEKKELREARTKRDLVLRTLYNATPFGLLRFKIDEGGLKLFSYNKTVWKLLHYKGEEEFVESAAFKDMFSGIYEEDRSEFFINMQAVINGVDGDERVLEHRVVSRDGQLIWLRATIKLIIIEYSEHYLQCAFEDITKYKTKAE